MAKNEQGEPLAPCPSETALDGAVICSHCQHGNPVGTDRCGNCGAVTCKRCQHQSAAGTDRCSRCKSTLRGNKLAVSHGLRAHGLPPDLEHLRDEAAAFEAGCLVDEADDDIPTRRRALLVYRARLHRRITQLDDALELRGLIDRRGRLRAAWLSQLQGLISTAKGLDTLLGLERKQKRLNIAEQFAAARAAADNKACDA